MIDKTKTCNKILFRNIKIFSKYMGRFMAWLSAYEMDEAVGLSLSR